MLPRKLSSSDLQNHLHSEMKSLHCAIWSQCWVANAHFQMDALHMDAGPESTRSEGSGEGRWTLMDFSFMQKLPVPWAALPF